MTIHHPLDRTRQRRAFVGAVSGHLIEWFDYGVYGFLAVTMGQLFFASDSAAVNLLSSFAVFALSFFIRPLGGFVLGPMADRVGRKQTLTLVMLLMSGSTFAIGLLPTYATIGVAAPLLLILLRCLQGFSAGGEIGTVTSFVAEYAGPRRRGFATSWLMTTAVLGLLLGALVANGMAALLGGDAMLAWGWRVPFLLAGPLGLVAAYIRFRLEDSPEFQALQASGTEEKAPLREAMRWKRALALVFCIIMLHSSIFYLVLTFASTFMSNTLGFDDSTRFWYVIVACGLAAAVMPLGGAFTDRYGRKPFLLVTAVLGTVSMFWFFQAAPGATPATFLPPLLATAVSFGLYASSTYATMTDLLPTRIRSTGISIAYNIPVAIFGGAAPFIAAWLITWSGDVTAPWYFFVGTGVVSIVALVVLQSSDFRRAGSASPHMSVARQQPVGAQQAEPTQVPAFSGASR